MFPNQLGEPQVVLTQTSPCAMRPTGQPQRDARSVKVADPVILTRQYFPIFEGFKLQYVEISESPDVGSTGVPSLHDPGLIFNSLVPNFQTRD